MIAIADDEGLHLLEFLDRKGLETELKWLQKKTKAAIVPGENIILTQITDELSAYFEGSSLHFSTPLATHGTPFEEEVWKTLRTKIT